MQGTIPHQYYPNEYIQGDGDHNNNSSEDRDHDHDGGNGPNHGQYDGNEIAHQPAPSLRDYHKTISDLDSRLRSMEKLLGEYENELQVKEDARITSDFENKKAKESYEQRIQHYERRIGDMTLHIRTRDTQFLKAQEKNRSLQRDFQTMQLKKHEMIQQAKREEREAMMKELDRERPSLDTKQAVAASASSVTTGGHGHVSTAAVGGARGEYRRQLSSGSIFTKAFAGQASAGSGGKGALKRTDQLRAACMESSLNDFFQLQS